MIKQNSIRETIFDLAWQALDISQDIRFIKEIKKVPIEDHIISGICDLARKLGDLANLVNKNKDGQSLSSDINIHNLFIEISKAIELLQCGLEYGPAYVSAFYVNKACEHLKQAINILSQKEV